MPAVPQIVNAGGRVMPSVRVVPVFFADDAHQTGFLDFLTKLARSDLWSAQVAEYGVGALSIASPVVRTDAAPTTIDDPGVQAMLLAGLDGTHAEWGAVDAATRATSVYVLFFPATTSIVNEAAGGAACRSFLGYHESAGSAEGRVIYAVVAECEPEPEKSYTATIGHELVEAATDPHPSTVPAFSDVDADHAAWSLAAKGGETADLCGWFRDGTLTPPALGYRLQRTWSNAAMRGFHDPCIPATPGQPYFASVPRLEEDIDTLVEDKHLTTKGIALRVGQSKTVSVDLLSDGPTSSAWDISATDAEVGLEPALALALDGTRGVNGDTLHLSVTALATRPSGGTVVDVISTLSGTTRHWPITVRISP